MFLHMHMNFFWSATLFPTLLSMFSQRSGYRGNLLATLPNSLCSGYYYRGNRQMRIIL